MDSNYLLLGVRGGARIKFKTYVKHPLCDWDCGGYLLENTEPLELSLVEDQVAVTIQGDENCVMSRERGRTVEGTPTLVVVEKVQIMLRHHFKRKIDLLLYRCLIFFFN